MRFLTPERANTIKTETLVIPIDKAMQQLNAIICRAAEDPTLSPLNPEVLKLLSFYKELVVFRLNHEVESLEKEWSNEQISFQDLRSRIKIVQKEIEKLPDNYEVTIILTRASNLLTQAFNGVHTRKRT